MKLAWKAGLLATVVWFSGSTAAEKPEFTFTSEHTFEPGGRTSLRVDNPVGRVSISAHAGPEIRVTERIVIAATDSAWAQSFLEDVQVDYELTEAGLRISARVIKPLRKRSFFGGLLHLYDYGRGQAHFEISVPSDCDLEVVTRWGSLEISDVAGRHHVESSTGAIRLSRLSGELKAVTGSGPLTMLGMHVEAEISASAGAVYLHESTGRFDIATATGQVQAQDLRGDLTVRAASSDVQVAGMQGALKARTHSGSILTDDIGGLIDVRTGSGEVSIALREPPRDTIQICTASGRASIAWPRGGAAELEVETITGRVEDDMGVAWRSDGARRAFGQVGTGGPRVQLRTQSGNIELGWSS